MSKTKSYADIVKQIESLKAEAETQRKKEVDGVIGRIREAISVYNLTAEDLGFAATKAKAAAAQPALPGTRQTKASKARKAGVKAAVKYSNGNGGTWAGRGKRPVWLRDALAGGKTLADFAVK
jgi:DNA-binding protein H-NS